MSKGSLFTALLACAATAVTAACAPVPAPPPPAPVAARGSSFNVRLLAAHNAERDRKHVPRLTWSADLAQQAQSWADRLAREDRMFHSDSSTRGKAGENLWTGTVGAYSPEDMIGAFVAEKADFKPGTFPNVSKTGKWHDVGHYTQVVWPTTQRVGCALAHNQEHDFLVCRYSPAGNILGRRID